MSQPADPLGEDVYVSRLLAHTAGQPLVDGNTVFQLSILLARIALEGEDADFCRETAKRLTQCLKDKPKAADNLVDLTIFRALRT